MERKIGVMNPVLIPAILAIFLNELLPWFCSHYTFQLSRYIVVAISLSDPIFSIFFSLKL